MLPESGPHVPGKGPWMRPNGHIPFPPPSPGWHAHPHPGTSPTRPPSSQNCPCASHVQLTPGRLSASALRPTLVVGTTSRAGLRPSTVIQVQSQKQSGLTFTFSPSSQVANAFFHGLVTFQKVLLHSDGVNCSSKGIWKRFSRPSSFPVCLIYTSAYKPD